MKRLWPVLGVFGLVWVLASCDAEPPSYLVHPPVLRMIADQGTLPLAGGDVFLVVELTPTDAGAGPYTLYLRAQGASSLALPGPSHCGPPVDGGAGDAGAGGPEDGGGGDAGSTDAGPTQDAGPDGGVELSQGEAQLVIPFIALRQNEALGTYETGVVVSAPPGEGDVLVLAAVYRAPDAASCVLPTAPLEAFAALRLLRAHPSADAGEPDAGADGGHPGDAGEPDGGTPDGGGVDGGQAGDGGSDDGGADSGTDAGSADSGADSGMNDAGVDGGADGGTDGGDGG